MQLLVQPDDGIGPILRAIQSARRSIDIHIFRLDRKLIEKALRDAIGRGVSVRTLIAHTAGGGEKNLRRLEQRLLEIGATVSRSADDLVRYHGKIMIVDREKLFVLGYNLTRNDIDRSRSLGISTKKSDLVLEALKLFEADFDRNPYGGNARDFLVSPQNARERLTAFIKGARRELLIYGQVTDNASIRALQERVRKGVAVRIIGKVERGHDLTAEKYPGPRLHIRAIVRDRRRAFVGSMGLRRLELDSRREIGVLVRDPKVVRKILDVFEADWANTEAGQKETRKGRKRKAEKGRAVKGRSGEGLDASA
jgi:phosphatidylserine/phosphatidylglycerophosphate/cardiolipin synthase-like enzyme